MNRTAFLVLFALLSTLLFGCQPENDRAEAEEVTSETVATESEGLLKVGDIAKVELSERKGMDPVVYEELAELEILKDAFSSASRQPGIVNMTNPNYYLKVVMADGEEYYLQLWLGAEGETTSLMDTADTHTIYSVSAAMNVKLIALVEE